MILVIPRYPCWVVFDLGNFLPYIPHIFGCQLETMSLSTTLLVRGFAEEFFISVPCHKRVVTPDLAPPCLSLSSRRRISTPGILYPLPMRYFLPRYGYTPWGCQCDIREFCCCLANIWWRWYEHIYFFIRMTSMLWPSSSTGSEPPFVSLMSLA